jgi:hypothetical protein
MHPFAPQDMRAWSSAPISEICCFGCSPLNLSFIKKNKEKYILSLDFWEKSPYSAKDNVGLPC